MLSSRFWPTVSWLHFPADFKQGAVMLRLLCCMPCYVPHLLDLNKCIRALPTCC